MAKRKLSHQQARRVASRRRQKDASSELPSDDTLGPQQDGLVLAHFGSQADIEAPEGLVIRCHLRANLGDIVAGDRVTWRAVNAEGQAQGGVVEALQPRLTELHRPDSFGKLKLVASNVDQALITIAPEPSAHANLIDRYLVMAEVTGFQPLLLVNKWDLVKANDELLKLEQHYQQLGYSIIRISAKSGEGVEQLTQALSSKTSIFVGQSGVGKSSILQALLPSEEIKIGKLSDQVKKGRHTTTHARLYHFASGGDVIDSPGIREFGLWHLSAEQVAQGFIEFRPFISQCKFRNCQHQNEPGCALQQALQDGVISADRFQSFHSIVAGLNDVEMRSPQNH